MSTTAPSRTSTVPSVTRQQLDELDALLQRMLDLPVQPFEETSARTSSVLETSLAVADPEPMTSVAGLAGVSLTLSGLGPEEPRERARPVSAARTRPMMVPGKSETPAPPPWLRVLVWSNRAFDRCARRLGAPGRWLRRPRGRALLGWAGLAFLIAALALLIADRIR